MSKPKETLVQYQPPIETSLQDSNAKSHKPSNYDSRLAIDCNQFHNLELLISMFPQLEWDADGKHLRRNISTNPPSREDVNSLQKMLD